MYVHLKFSEITCDLLSMCPVVTAKLDMMSIPGGMVGLDSCDHGPWCFLHSPFEGHLKKETKSYLLLKVIH